MDETGTTVTGNEPGGRRAVRRVQRWPARVWRAGVPGTRAGLRQRCVREAHDAAERARVGRAVGPEGDGPALAVVAQALAGEGREAGRAGAPVDRREVPASGSPGGLSSV